MSRSTPQDSVDVVVVGGGIVGLATGADLARRYPDLRLLVLEKEREIGAHQTGHNSGVIHSGIYYKPGSLKATTCRLGKALMEEFCRTEGIAWDRCGKVIVATEPDELPRLHALAERGQQNGVSCEILSPERLRELEPNVTGLAAIHVPEAGRADYPGVVKRLAQILRDAGHRVLTGHGVTAIGARHDGLEVRTEAGAFHTRFLVNCAGLHSDRIAALTSNALPARIVPFRGEYYQLTPAALSLVRTLVYPVPDPRFPFLGVHFTKTLTGKVKCGPNAVLAFAREGYRKSDCVPGDLLEALGYQGFQRLAVKHWRYGWSEIVRSFWKPAFLASLQRLVPAVRSDHLEPGPTGVRAQAVATDGSLVDDFCFMEQERVVHVINAPSPGATASLAIGQHIVDRLATRFESREIRPAAVAGASLAGR